MTNRSSVMRPLTAFLFALLVLPAGLIGAAGRAPGQATPVKAQPPRTMRLYIFDCGLLNITTEGVQRYHVTPAEVSETRMSVPCFLVAHPKGTLTWELGVIPDDIVDARGQGAARSSVNVTATS